MAYSTFPHVISAFLLQLTTAAAATSSRRLNVLFLVCDDLRPQMNAAYGQTYMHTPNFDKLAKSALTFDFAFTNFAICSPSRNSFMSGRLPDNTRTWNFIDDFRKGGVDKTGASGMEWTSLPEHFKNNGYRVYGHGKLYHPKKPPQNDEPRSWSQDQTYWPLTGKAYCPRVLRGERYCPGKTNETAEYSDYEMVGHAMDTLRKVAADFKENGTNFGVFVGLHYPHQPWHTPDWTRRIYPPATELAPAVHQKAPKNCPDVAFTAELDGIEHLLLNENLPGFADSKPHNVSGLVSYPCASPLKNTVPRYFQQQLRMGYYSAVTLSDFNLGRLLDLANELGIENDTVVVLTGDHGYQLGEHAEWGKHTNFELAVQVPLLIRTPNSKSAGRHTQSFAELVDLYRTVASLAGLPKPEKGVDGDDLSDLLRDPDQKIKQVAYAQYSRCPGDRWWPFRQRGHPAWYYNNCEKVPATDISFMGYSIRNPDWRYTAWYHWNGTTCSVDFRSLPYARELYSHVGQAPYPLDFDAWENENLAAEPAFADVVQELHANLVTKFAGVAKFGCPAHGGEVSLEDDWGQPAETLYV